MAACTLVTEEIVHRYLRIYLYKKLNLSLSTQMNGLSGLSEVNKEKSIQVSFKINLKILK